MSTKDESLAETGRAAADSIREMVAALECDYERRAELRDAERDAGEDEELAESVEVRSGWVEPYGAVLKPEEFCILLSTGGPASRIRGELDEHCEPKRAWLEVQDWGTPWTQYFDIEQDTLLAYARCFYFGEG